LLFSRSVISRPDFENTFFQIRKNHNANSIVAGAFFELLSIFFVELSSLVEQ